MLTAIRTCRLVALLSEPSPDRKRRPDRSLRVVLVHDGRAEDRHHRVADELLDRPAVTLDLPLGRGMEGPQGGTHVLRVSRIGAGGEADEVADENGDDLALLRGSGRARRPWTAGGAADSPRQP